MNPDDLRVVLIQVRDADDPMAAHEEACIRRRIGARPVHVETVNVLLEHVSTSWLDGADAIIIGGSGDYSVHDPRSSHWVGGLRQLLERALRDELAGFGICFGHQLLAQHLGVRVHTDGARAEIGTVDIQLTDAGRADPVFGELELEFKAHTGHSDHVTAVPTGVELLASSETLDTQAFRVSGTRFYSTQFHPDMTGAEALSRYTAYSNSFDEVMLPGVGEAVSRFQPGADATSVLLARFVDCLLDERE
jgi:GMP synthase (glutamine-hydrolysing)